MNAIVNIVMYGLLIFSGIVAAFITAAFIMMLIQAAYRKVLSLLGHPKSLARRIKAEKNRVKRLRSKLKIKINDIGMNINKIHNVNIEIDKMLKAKPHHYSDVDAIRKVIEENKKTIDVSRRVKNMLERQSHDLWQKENGLETKLKIAKHQIDVKSFKNGLDKIDIFLNEVEWLIKEMESERWDINSDLIASATSGYDVSLPLFKARIQKGEELELHVLEKKKPKILYHQN